MMRPPIRCPEQTTNPGSAGGAIFFAAACARQLLAIVLALTLALPALAAEGGTAGKDKKKAKSPAGSQLEGSVVGPDGKPVREAIVSVRSLDGETTWSSLPSDRRGQFRLRGLPYGWADLVVTTPQGKFLGDQAINLPPGTRVVVKFDLLETADKPTSWWSDRRVEVPSGVDLSQVAGMAQSSQRLTGIEYWKSPGGIAILASVSVVALALIAGGGGKYKAPSTP